jgi:hypothetical protein
MWELQCHFLLFTILSETELEDPQKVLWCSKHNYYCISVDMSAYIPSTVVWFAGSVENLQARRCDWPDLSQKAFRYAFWGPWTFPKIV